MNRMIQICASIALALTFVDDDGVRRSPPLRQRQGQKCTAAAIPGSKAKSDDDHYDDRFYDDKDKNSNHGQIVSRVQPSRTTSAT